jgi:hypothetical protein
MQDPPSGNPQDRAIRAALRDASALAAMVATAFTATYRGHERTTDVSTLAGSVTDVGGHLGEAEHG